MCERLPLALNLVGRSRRGDPSTNSATPGYWKDALGRLQDKKRMFKTERVSDDGTLLLPVMDAAFSMLPTPQKKQFRLMVVVAPEASITSEMMARVWDTVRES